MLSRMVILYHDIVYYGSKKRITGQFPEGRFPEIAKYLTNQSDYATIRHVTNT